VTVLIILSTYIVVAFTVFMVRYVYNIHDDFDGAFIFAWPIAITVWLVHTSIIVSCDKIQTWWIKIGGPKIRKIDKDTREKEREQAYDKLHIAFLEARNAICIM
jgi:hypothetical protein